MGRVFYIEEKKDRRNTAGAKAPADIVALCAQRGYLNFQMEHFPDGKPTYYKKAWLLTVCVGQWRKLMKTVQAGDVVIFQHPSYGKRVALRWIPKIQKKKGCKFIALIHDLESLRRGIAGVVNDNRRTNEIGDRELLKCFDAVICHNEHMRQYLVEQGFDPDRLVNLEIFDYLTDCEVRQPSEGENASEPSIAIAGNLAIGKCRYIYKIQDRNRNRHLKIHLFGNNYEAGNATENMVWHGSFPPEEIPGKLEGAFGLVWDGESAETCAGNTGNYLRYNNPHKTSLYLASGLPVIVWSEAAIADFVLKHHVGIAVDSLLELEDRLQQISPEEYGELKNNAVEMAQRLRSGCHFYAALDQAMAVALSNGKDR